MPNVCKEELETLIMRMNPQLSQEQAAEVLALTNMRDEDIDLSDIPQVDFSKAGIRGLLYRGPTIRLREDLRVYFANLACRKGVPMNDLVNDTLAKAVEMVAIAEVVK